MVNRHKLDGILRNILGTGNVYFQPPENKKLSYPCIIYSLNPNKNTYADNKKYIKFECYKIIYIDRAPNSTIPDEIEELPMCELETPPYVYDGLNHWVFKIYIP